MKINRISGQLFLPSSQATKQVATTLDDDILQEEEFRFKSFVSLTLHHDAITGTSRQSVMNDYKKYLAEGIDMGKNIFSRVLKFVYLSSIFVKTIVSCTITSAFSLQTAETFTGTITRSIQAFVICEISANVRSPKKEPTL